MDLKAEILIGMIMDRRKRLLLNFEGLLVVLFQIVW